MEKAEVVAALAALAQESRLDIFRLLVQAGPDGLPAGQIAEKLNLPGATLSFHLSGLRHAGLVRFRRESRSLIYVAEYAAMNALISYLTENCCHGEAASCGAGDTPQLIKPGKGIRQ
jgi:DNA-binding transcriptional ArsR family regulator